MISTGRVFSTLAVKDRDTNKKFYGGLLGLKQIDENPGGVMYESGGGKLFVYESPTAGTNQATSATWAVDDIDEAVKSLQNKGIKFEHYKFPGGTMEGDIHVMGPMKAAWFKDPDGNILALAMEHKR